jgi:hypothetical protein
MHVQVAAQLPVNTMHPSCTVSWCLTLTRLQFVQQQRRRRHRQPAAWADSGFAATNTVATPAPIASIFRPLTKNERRDSEFFFTFISGHSFQKTFKTAPKLCVEAVF